MGPNQGKLDSVTTYATNFDYKGVYPTIAERPQSRKDLLKNDNKNYNETTTYTMQYQAGVGDRAQKVIHPSEIVLGSDKGVERESHYTHSYRDGKLQPRLIAKSPAPYGVLPNGSF